MSGCARTCILWPLGWLVAAGAFFLVFRAAGLPEPALWWASGIAGFCTGTAIGYAIGVRGLSKERQMLLDAARGATPPDGTWVAVTGAIRSASPLRAPITGVEAVAYEYRITRDDKESSDSSALLYYEGKALARSTIGAVRLLSVPSLDVPRELGRKGDVEHARQYVAATKFETRETPRDERKGVEAESMDDDGEFRRDREYHGGTDVSDCDFEERHIRNGETVCAFGLYSRERGGLVPHANWAKPTRIMRGEASVVAEQLRLRLRRWKTFAIVLTVIAVAVTVLVLGYAAFAR